MRIIYIVGYIWKLFERWDMVERYMNCKLWLRVIWSVIYGLELYKFWVMVENYLNCDFFMIEGYMNCEIGLGVILIIS